MFELVEKKHNNKFWKVFIEMVDEHKNHSITSCESGASEYELYFNFMIKYHTDKMIIRELNWVNVSNYMYCNNLYDKYDLHIFPINIIWLLHSILCNLFASQQ